MWRLRPSRPSFRCSSDLVGGGRQASFSCRPMSPAEVTAFIRDQQELWKPAIERIADQMK